MLLLEWLHLVALGDRCGCGFLVSLGGCCHLDGLEQRRSFGTYWWLFVASSGDYEGSCTFPGRESNGNSSGLLVSLSYHTCGYVLAVSNCVDKVHATPLSHQTTKCWSTQRGLVCRQAREPREKKWLSLALCYSPGDWFSIHLVIGSLLYTAV